jgi:hypothetical protein
MKEPIKAFPELNFTSDGEFRYSSEGMDLRDYFAAKAMQLFLHDSQKIHGQWNAEGIAQDSYEMADAMMEARLK